MSLESICHFCSMYWTIMLTVKKEWMEGICLMSFNPCPDQMLEIVIEGRFQGAKFIPFFLSLYAHMLMLKLICDYLFCYYWSCIFWVTLWTSYVCIAGICGV